MKAAPNLSNYMYMFNGLIYLSLMSQKMKLTTEIKCFLAVYIICVFYRTAYSEKSVIS